MSKRYCWQEENVTLMIPETLEIIRRLDSDEN